MRILFHATAVLLFAGLFLMGKLAVERRVSWAHTLTLKPIPQRRLCSFLLYGGKTFEAIALVLGFLEAVALLIVMFGSVIDQLVSIAL